jgi:hypothetical protein
MDRGLRLKKVQGLFSKSGYEWVSNDVGRWIRTERPRLNKGREKRGFRPPTVTGGEKLAGGEQLLIGVAQSGGLGHDSTNGLHQKIKETNASSPDIKTEVRTDGGRRATSNGGQRTPVHGCVSN